MVGHVTRPCSKGQYAEAEDNEVEAPVTRFGSICTADHNCLRYLGLYGSLPETRLFNNCVKNIDHYVVTGTFLRPSIVEHNEYYGQNASRFDQIRSEMRLSTHA